MVAGDDAFFEEGHEGIDDDEPGLDALDGVADGEGVGGECDQLVAAFADDALEDVDAVEVGTEAAEARLDGVFDAVFAVQDDGAGWRHGGGRFGPGVGFGEWGSAGDAGAEIQGEEGFAEAGVAVEDGEFSQGEAVGPEPGYGLLGGIVDAEELQVAVPARRGGHGRCSGGQAGRLTCGRQAGKPELRRCRAPDADASLGARRIDFHVRFYPRLSALWEEQFCDFF